MPDRVSSIPEQFGLAIGDCARIWRNRVNERLKPLGLSQAAWLALWHLSFFPGGIGQTDLAERLGIEGPTLVRLLDRLAADSLIRREIAPHDKRCKQVVLTDDAKPVLAQVRAIIADLRGEIMAGIPDTQLLDGLRLLALIRTRLAVA